MFKKTYVHINKYIFFKSHRRTSSVGLWESYRKWNRFGTLRMRDPRLGCAPPQNTEGRSLAPALCSRFSSWLSAACCCLMPGARCLVPGDRYFTGSYNAVKYRWWGVVKDRYRWKNRKIYQPHIFSVWFNVASLLR